MNPAYIDIMEDVSKSEAILEENDILYRTDDAAIYAGFKNTTDVISVKTKDPEKWLVPSESAIRVRFQLTNAAGNAALADGQIVTMIAGGLHLFEQIRLLVDNNQIELVTKPGYVHLIEHLLTSSKDNLRSVAENEWLYLDNGSWELGAYTAGATVNIVGPPANTQYSNPYILSTTAVPTAANVNHHAGLADPMDVLGTDVNGANMGGFNPKFNSGYRARWVRTAAGKEVDLEFPASRLFGFFADVRCAFRGLQFELEFTRNQRFSEILHGQGIWHAGTALTAPPPPTNPAFHAEAAPAAVVIKKIDWVVPTYIPSTLMLEKVQRQLMSDSRVTKVFHSARTYDFIKQTGITAGPNNTIDWRVQSTGKRITRIVVGLQRAGQYSTQNDPGLTTTQDTHNNGGVFSHLQDITNIELRFGSIIIPRERYTDMTFNEASPNIMRNFIEFCDAGGKWLNDDGCLISYDSYRDLYPLFAFDLNGVDLTKMNTTTEDLRILITSTNANTDAYRILAVVQYEYPVDMWGVNGRLALELP